MHNEICSSYTGKSRAAGIQKNEITRTATAFAAVVEDAAVRFFDTVLAWHERARSRHDLARLDDRMLSDIGVSRAEVDRETTVPFWH